MRVKYNRVTACTEILCIPSYLIVLHLFFNLVVSGTAFGQVLQNDLFDRDPGFWPTLSETAWEEIKNEELAELLTIFDVDVTDEDGYTALMYAAALTGDPLIIDELIAAGADVNTQNRFGETALMIAAAFNSEPSVITSLINGGADVNTQNDSGETALMFAAELSASPEIINTLITAGAEVNTQDRFGWTALMIAAKYNETPSILERLIENNADVNTRNQDGYTPLMQAIISNSSPRIIEALLTAEINVNARNQRGLTALILAVMEDSSVEVIEQLIAAGADANARAEDGSTVLMWAASMVDNPEIIDRLLDAGSDVNARNVMEWSALMIAARWNSNSLVSKRLISAGADLEARGMDGETALTLASRWNNNQDIIDELLDAGVDVFLRNDAGQSAWDVIQFNDPLRNTNAYWRLIDQEISERAKRIDQATSIEERERLDAEQQRARAVKAARLLEAEQLVEIEAQARQALEQRQLNEALRFQMEQEFASQRERLIDQVNQRRSELMLKEEQDTKPLFETLNAITEINKAIENIQSHFEATVSRMEQEVETLYNSRLQTMRENNPREPWDTEERYEALIEELTAQLGSERRSELSLRRNNIIARREEELADLRLRLENHRASITGQQYILGFSNTTVSVSDFEPNDRLFPLHIRAKDEHHTFNIPASYTIRSTNRQVLRDEYFRMFSADQSGALAAEISYTVFELEPNLWVLQPIQTRVIHLLEGDLELLRLEGSFGQMLVDTSASAEPVLGVAHFAVQSAEPAEVWIDGRRKGNTDLRVLLHNPEDLGLRRVEYRWQDGTRRAFTLNFIAGINAPVSMSINDNHIISRRNMILVTGAPPETALRKGHSSWTKTRLMGTATPEENLDNQAHIISWIAQGAHRVLVTGRWLIQEIDQRMTFSENSAGEVVHIDLQKRGLTAGGELQGQFPRDRRSIVSIHDGEGHVVIESIETDNPLGTLVMTLHPGEYQLVVRQEYDPYPAVIVPVSIQALQTTGVVVSEVPLSARSRLETAQAHRAQLEQRIAQQQRRRVVGWSFLGAGVLGAGGASYSYIQAQDAILSYDNANDTAGVRSARRDVRQWGVRFSLSAILTGASAITGTSILAFGPDYGSMLQERNELDDKIESLIAEVVLKHAEHESFGRNGR